MAGVLPAARRGGDVDEQRAIDGILAAPARESIPALGEALVHDLDDVLAFVLARHEQARVDQVREHGRRAGQLLELAARHRDARAVGGDEARPNRSRTTRWSRFASES